MEKFNYKPVKPLFILLIGLFTVEIVSADNKAVNKFRDFTPEQIKALPEKVRRSEVPTMYVLAAQTGLAPDAPLLFSLQLNLLMYPAVGEYASAIRAFQKDMGDTPNGNLTVHQIQQLEYRANLQKLSRIAFPDDFYSWISSDSAVVKGTLSILNDQIAWPINHQNVVCFKSQKQCEVTQLILDVPNEKSWAQRYQIMTANTEYYNITRWENDAIDAEYPGTPDRCRTTSLNLNFKTKEFFFITKNSGGKCEILGKPIEKLSMPRISQILDGKNIIEGEFSRLEKAAYEVLASNFRKKVEDFNSKLTNK